MRLQLSWIRINIEKADPDLETTKLQKNFLISFVLTIKQYIWSDFSKLLFHRPEWFVLANILFCYLFSNFSFYYKFEKDKKGSKNSPVSVIAKDLDFYCKKYSDRWRYSHGIHFRITVWRKRSRSCSAKGWSKPSSPPRRLPWVWTCRRALCSSLPSRSLTARTSGGCLPASIFRYRMLILLNWGLLKPFCHRWYKRFGLFYCTECSF